MVYYKELERNFYFNLLKNATVLPSSFGLPQKVTPNGLDAERQRYLFKEIRQFCKPGTEDLVAPSPLQT